MPEQILIENCSPTLAGLKTANLVNIDCAGETAAQILQDIRMLNQALQGKGVRAMPLVMRGSHVLLYMYRPAMLRDDMRNPLCRRILSSRGYTGNNMEECLQDLADRIRKMTSSVSFPHEIGLFLGYPPEDVEAFITHRDVGCKCVGTWRVYGDEASARKTFDRFRRCTAAYCEQYSRGKSIAQLTVRGQDAG